MLFETLFVAKLYRKHFPFFAVHRDNSPCFRLVHIYTSYLGNPYTDGASPEAVMPKHLRTSLPCKLAVKWHFYCSTVAKSERCSECRFRYWESTGHIPPKYCKLAALPLSYFATQQSLWLSPRIICQATWT